MGFSSSDITFTFPNYYLLLVDPFIPLFSSPFCIIFYSRFTEGQEVFFKDTSPKLITLQNLYKAMKLQPVQNTNTNMSEYLFSNDRECELSTQNTPSSFLIFLYLYLRLLSCYSRANDLDLWGRGRNEQLILTNYFKIFIV